MKVGEQALQVHFDISYPKKVHFDIPQMTINLTFTE